MRTTDLTAPSPRAGLATWWPVLIGIIALIAPTYYDLANTLWGQEEYAHGPIVLAVVLYLVWQKRDALLQHGKPQPVIGWTLLIFGLLTFIIGRSQNILLLEVGGQLPVFLGILLITSGVSAARSLWFPLFFLLFVIPLPGFIVDRATGPLKEHVSILAENILYYLGYPIARSGVSLSIGQYQLLVADACSGLHSMFSLSAMGLLYLYLMRRTDWRRNAILIASILPLAFLSNVIRVIALVLITYYMGDEAAQGFLHQTAGITLFIVGLLLLFALDALLGFFFPDKTPAEARKQESP